ncbi:malonate--CoA ligase [Sphingomonas flavalba]|uniref:malonate--CoA ligase n=1 Tax=Sphingomonas flavalba TaxID=2559804 RepID=UPI0039E0B7C2
MSGNLFEALWAGKTGGAVAFDRPGQAELSYAALHAASGRLANRLVALGVGPDDRIAVQVAKSAEAVMLYLASLRVGAVYLPLNDGYTPAEVSYFLNDARPRLLVVDPAAEAQAMALAGEAGAAVATLDADGGGSLTAGIERMSADFTDVVRTGGDLAAILYTSGTTGRSKGAMLTHRNLLSNAEALAALWRFSADDVLLHALPIYHTHGLFVAINVALLAGAAVRLLPRFTPDAVFAALPGATVMMGVPTFYTRLLADRRLDRAATAGMRLFVSGSAPLLADTHRAWEAATGHRILERYGMTETGMNTSNPYDGERRPGTVGPALHGVSVRVVDPESRAPLAADSVGMIEVRGPNVFKGYWQMPERTAAELHADGYFTTGDLGRISADGYVEIVGRGKDLIITGGLNVYPKEVESAIDALDGVVESAVIGVPHPDFGEAVTAIIVREPGAEVSEAAIGQALAARLARFKLPKTILFVDALPRNSMGKVQKSVLRAECASPKV